METPMIPTPPRDPQAPLPGQSREPAPVERAPRDLEEVWEQGDKLRRLVEEKLAHLVARSEKGLGGWAEKLERLRARLEEGLAGLDERTDRVLGRGPAAGDDRERAGGEP